MENRYTITMDIKKGTILNARFKQGDTDSSVLEVKLIDNGAVVDITGQNIEFNFLRPDGIVTTQDSTNGVSILDAANGKFQCILKNSTLSTSGDARCDIIFYKNGKELGTKTFNFVIDDRISGGSLSITAINAKMIEWQTKFDEMEEAYETATHDNSLLEVVNARKGEVDLATKIGKIDSSLLDGVQSIRKFGVNGDGTDETAKIQNALNSCVGKILFWNKQLGSYYLTGQLFIPSNTTIIFEPNTSVKAIDTLIQTLPAESLFTLIDVENIIIEGNNSTLFMDKSKYFSEHTHCLKLNSVCNVTVNNMNFNTAGGDGIFVGNTGGQLRTSSERVKLYNCVCDGNRRQGLSICSASDFVAYNCEFNNTIGTAPECGVDIEPNSNIDRLNNIRFVKCKASGNANRGFMVALIDHTNVAESTDIIFEDCCTTSNIGGYFVNNFLRGTRGEIKFINCKAEFEKLYGFYESLCNGKTLYKDCLAYNCNTSNYVNQGNNAYGSSYHIYADDIGSMKGGNVIFDNCTSLDDREPKLIRYGFTIGSVNNVIPTNIKMLNCKVDGAVTDNYGISPLATGIQIENINPPVKSFTTTGAIATNYIGHIINNAGATVPRTLTLPIAKDGYRYDIYIEKAFGLTIVPATGGQILALTSAINKSINSVNVGSSIALKGRSDGNWDVIKIVGTWTEVA